MLSKLAWNLKEFILCLKNHTQSWSEKPSLMDTVSFKYGDNFAQSHLEAVHSVGMGGHMKRDSSRMIM